MLTEEQWHTSGDPEAMLAVLRGNVVATDRKMRLFACSCVELILARLPNRSEYQHILTTGERMAAGTAEVDEVREREYDATAQEALAGTKAEARIAVVVGCVLSRVAYSTACGILYDSFHQELDGIRHWTPESFAQRLRCICGNPYRGYKVGFRPFVFNPAWRTDTAITLARQMYDSRDFGAMPILADALQDAGCEDEQVLSHCRAAGPHARGCWVVDGVLGLA